MSLHDVHQLYVHKSIKLHHQNPNTNHHTSSINAEHSRTLPSIRPVTETSLQEGFVSSAWKSAKYFWLPDSVMISLSSSRMTWENSWSEDVWSFKRKPTKRMKNIRKNMRGHPCNEKSVMYTIYASLEDYITAYKQRSTKCIQNQKHQESWHLFAGENQQTYPFFLGQRLRWRIPTTLSRFYCCYTHWLPCPAFGSRI